MKAGGKSGGARRERPVLVLATRNPGKVREIGALLAGLEIDLRSLLDYPEVTAAQEDGNRDEENAAAKARAAAGACGVTELADDSGLEVDALGGEPGVQSARWSGRGPAANIEKLLSALGCMPASKRTARFRCAVVTVRPDGATLSAEGSCEGRIGESPRGKGGFGYDPVFVDPASGLTFAELPPERKNRISHRARACAALRERLLDFLRAA